MLGAETVELDEEDPVEAMKELTRGIGPNRAIDAVGVDSERPKSGPAAGEHQGPGGASSCSRSRQIASGRQAAGRAVEAR